MKKLLLLLGAWLCCLCELSAQTRVITGKVLDEKNNPVANVSVVVKGTTRGTTTNETGDFTLSVPSSATTLVLTSVNYATAEVDITTNTSPTIKLQPTTGSLNEVVVVAYGNQRKNKCNRLSGNCKRFLSGK